MSHQNFSRKFQVCNRGIQYHQGCECWKLHVQLHIAQRQSTGGSSVKCTLCCRLAALHHILCLHSAFDGNRASLQHQQHGLMSLNWLCVLFIFRIQFRYRCIQGFAESLQHTPHTGTQLAHIIT